MSTYSRTGWTLKPALRPDKITAVASLSLVVILGSCWADGPPVGSTEVAASDPAGIQTTSVSQGITDTATIFFDRNFSNVPLAAFPGVTVASLTLPPGSYVINAKFRYRGNGTAPSQAGCVYQSTLGSIGGLDASANSGTLTTGTVDGYMMDIFTNSTAGNAEVHVQCFGPATVSIINPQFAATAAALTLQ